MSSNTANQWSDRNELALNATVSKIQFEHHEAMRNRCLARHNLLRYTYRRTDPRARSSIRTQQEHTGGWGR